MKDYFIRCTQADVPTLRALGVALGLLRQEGGVWFAVAPHAYQELGALPGKSGDPVMAPDGKPYWHANLRLCGPTLLERARDAVERAPNPAITAAMKPESFPRFFVVSKAGEADWPTFPVVVFA